MSPYRLRQFTALSFAQGAAQMILDDTVERFPEDLKARGALARMLSVCKETKLYYPDPLPGEIAAGKAKMERFFAEAGWGGVAGMREAKKHPQTYMVFVSAILVDEVDRIRAERKGRQLDGKLKRMLKVAKAADDVAAVFPENGFCYKGGFRAADVWASLDEASLDEASPGSPSTAPADS